MNKNIVIYGQMSLTSGEVYYLGYEEGNSNTGDVIIIKKGDEDDSNKKNVTKI